MRFQGIQKTSLIDFPGKISTVLFTSGCNYRCSFCHNPDLVCNNPQASIDEDTIIEMLLKRKKVINSIVITGGEPTINADLFSFITKLKKFNFNIKLDTNGTNPSLIYDIIKNNLVDYIALDIKTSPEKYPLITNSKIPFDYVLKTFEYLNKYNINYEVRTTCVPGYINNQELLDIKKTLKHVSNYYLQQFHNDKTLDPSLKYIKPYPEEVLFEFKNIVQTFSDYSAIRGL